MMDSYDNVERLKAFLDIYLGWVSAIYQVSGEGGGNGGTCFYILGRM